MGPRPQPRGGDGLAFGASPAAGHRRAAGLYASLIRESHLARQQSLATPARMAESNAEHAAMLDAAAAGDAALARALGEAHVAEGGKRRWIESLGEG